MQIADQLSQLNALSPLDGRYATRGDALRGLLSEAGFMAHRVEVEVAWLIALSDAGLPELPAFSESARARLQQLVRDFSESDAARIKDIERVTNHDVKAVEYWLKEKVADDAELARAVGSRSNGRARRLLSYMDQRGFVITRNDRGGNRIIALPGLGWETAPGDPNAVDESPATQGGDLFDVA